MLRIPLPAPSPFSAVSPAAVCSGVCHGTLGELVQGPVLHEGELQIGLISLPLQKYSWMHFVGDGAGDHAAELPEKSKCRRAIALYLDHYGLAWPQGHWLHDSELLLGKGMASSTADIVASIRCLDRLFARASPPLLIADILRQVERSDSVFLDCYALYLSARQTVLCRFVHDPQFHVCYIDEGDSVDTEAMSARLLAHYRARLDDYACNLQQAVTAFERSDRAAIARCATRSAELAQAVLPKRYLAAMLAQRERFGAAGIVVAHTGSLVGYLFLAPPDAVAMGELSAFFRALGYQCRFAQSGFPHA
jgi:uncharacterized protein involved in propanediol utilization